MPEGLRGEAGIMRGFFGIGAEGISKAGNVGNPFRSAHGFGTSFLFLVAPDPRMESPGDTSASQRNLPVYTYAGIDDMRLPEGRQLVGVELVDGAVDLSSFHHPHGAAYVLGAGTGQPVAGAIVMYDRLRALGRFAHRPVVPAEPPASREPVTRSDKEKETVRLSFALFRTCC